MLFIEQVEIECETDNNDQSVENLEWFGEDFGYENQLENDFDDEYAENG